MFAVEFFQKLKEYNSSSIEDKPKILKSIYNLSRQNESEFNLIITKEANNPQISKLLNDLNEYENSLNLEKENKNQDDLTKIKNYYYLWRSEFLKNNQINEKSISIVNEIIDFYMINRIKVLNKIFEIEDDDIFHKFKMQLKNNLRFKLSKKIEDYLNSEKFSSLSFFQKMKKKREIKSILNDLVEYKFDFEKLNEVIK